VQNLGIEHAAFSISATQETREHQKISVATVKMSADKDKDEMFSLQDSWEGGCWTGRRNNHRNSYHNLKLSQRPEHKHCQPVLMFRFERT